MELEREVGAFVLGGRPTPRVAGGVSAGPTRRARSAPARRADGKTMNIIGDIGLPVVLAASA